MDKLVPRGHYLVSFISPLMNEGEIFEIIYPAPHLFEVSFNSIPIIHP